MLSLAALKCDAVHKALEVDINDIAVLSSALTGQLTALRSCTRFSSASTADS